MREQRWHPILPEAAAIEMLGRPLYILRHKTAEEASMIRRRVNVGSGDMCMLVRIGSAGDDTVNLLGVSVGWRHWSVRDAEKLM